MPNTAVLSTGTGLLGTGYEIAYPQSDILGEHTRHKKSLPPILHRDTQPSSTAAAGQHGEAWHAGTVLLQQRAKARQGIPKSYSQPTGQTGSSQSATELPSACTRHVLTCCYRNAANAAPVCKERARARLVTRARGASPGVTSHRAPRVAERGHRLLQQGSYNTSWTTTECDSLVL